MLAGASSAAAPGGHASLDGGGKVEASDEQVLAAALGRGRSGAGSAGAGGGKAGVMTKFKKGITGFMSGMKQELLADRPDDAP